MDGSVARVPEGREEEMIIMAFLAGCVATWFAVRQHANARVSHGVRLALERDERKRRVRRSTLLVGAAVALVVILAVWR